MVLINNGILIDIVDYIDVDNLKIKGIGKQVLSIEVHIICKFNIIVHMNMHK